MVLSVLIDDGKERLLYSSDLMGPQIEDYAAHIIREKPDVIILDGPPIYVRDKQDKSRGGPWKMP